MTKYECDAGPIIDLVSSGIKKIEPLAKYNPTRKKELVLLRQALATYKRDCVTCKRDADNDLICLKAALDKLFRNLPFIRNSVYPWKNYDWNYGNFIDNNYSAMATGSSKSGGAYISNLGIFFKLFNAYIFSANPNSKSVAGGTDENSDYPKYGCLGNKKKYCDVWHRVKNNDGQTVPYKNAFFNKKTDGKYSSSYFIKVGTCPRPDITDRNECSKKNYEWIDDPLDTVLSSVSGGIPDGSCHQPRYAFINNKPGIPLFRGFTPSLINDVASLTPDKLFLAYTGNSIPGYLNVQKCPKMKKKALGYKKENFTNINEQNILFRKILSGVTVSFLILIISIIYFYKWYYG